MKNLSDPPVNKTKKKLNKEPEVTNRDVENTVEGLDKNEATTTESELIVNEQSQDQAVNSSDRLNESGKEEFLD
ncbi:MAG: hypothetical protein ACXWV5_00465 [Flavitalea sp.]